MACRIAPAADLEPAAVQALIRELVALNTPGLFLNVVQRDGPVRVVLKPWDGRTTRFRGAHFVIEAGAEATEGVEAFLRTPLSHVTALYPAAPDHPVYVVSIEHQGTLVYAGQFPAYLTHLTLLVNGRTIVRCRRLLHERGPQVFASVA